MRHPPPLRDSPRRRLVDSCVRSRNHGSTFSRVPYRKRLQLWQYHPWQATTVKCSAKLSRGRFRTLTETDAKGIRLGYFSLSIVSRVAAAQGTYTAYGVDVVEQPVASSVDQFRRLVWGELDVLLTSPDNVLTYRVNHSNPIGSLVDVRVLRAVDGGMGLSLMARAGTSGIAALRGARIGVDSAASGFAYALYAVLEAAGLRVGDYELVELGSTPRRAVELAAGGCDATLLGSGHDVLAERRGAVRLVRVSAALGPYPGAVLAAKADVIHDRGPAIARFLSAWDQAVADTLDPRRGSMVTSVLGAGLDVPKGVADEVYRSVVDPRDGLVPDGRLDPEGWALVVDLRRRAGGFDVGTDPGRLRREPPLA